MKLHVPKESTVDESQSSESALPEFVTFNKIKYRAVRILLLKDLPEDFGVNEYKAGANVIAGVDSDGDVWIPTVESNGKSDVAKLADGEFQVVELTEMQPDESIEPIASEPPHIACEKPADIHTAETAYLEAAESVEQLAAEIERLQSEHAAAIERHKELGVELCRVLESRLRETLEETDCEVTIKGQSETKKQKFDREHPDPGFDPDPLGTAPWTTRRTHSNTSEQPTGDYSGLSAPISELWTKSPVDRLGKKKREALSAACPTIGDFEKLREQAGRAFKQLHELLPDGIGQGVADELENRQLDWLARSGAAVTVETTDDQPQAATDDTSPPDAEKSTDDDYGNADGVTAEASPYAFE